MSDLILSPIADRIIGGLASEAVKQIALIWGVKNDLEELEDTISTIKAVLVDAEEKQAHNNQVKLWLERLVDAVHEADDLVDEFDTEALRRRVMSGSETTKQVRTFFSSSNQIAFRYKMGRRIRKIKKKLAKVSRARAFHLDERSDGGRVVGRGERETHSFVSQEDVVGRETERNEIVRVLLGDDRDFTAEHDSKENVLIVPIVGMGGLGKTTLAQSAFNDEKVKRHFVLKIWVCVSDNFELRFVVRQIIGSGGGGGGDGSIEQLQKELRELVGGKRFLLVLDDVWLENREKWLKLKELLVSGADGSRVVVTTRSNVVADVMGTSRPYQLGVLDKENSWSLFKKMAFKHGKEPESPDLVNIARDIASKCGGVPLALRAIGSMLYSKSLGLESWSFFNKEFSNIVSQQQGNEILPTLKLSYNHLPSNLKHCFAYCRLFPKDYIIEVPKLIGLWMAQGFLKSPYSRDQCLEDVGYGYFVDLYERSFFQEVETDEWGAVRSCKMHDLMHDLAVKVAGLEYETLTNRGKINKNTRHVSLDFHDTISTGYIPTSLHDASKLRTILLLNPDIEMNHKTICVITSYKLLRSLDLHGSGIEMVPDSVGELKHLRYLDLSFNWSIKRLPNSITNLLNLETLK